MPDQQAVRARDVLAFLCELAMLVLLVAAGHGLAGGWKGWALGTLSALVVIGLWSQWMAPTSARRLENPRRLGVQILLFMSVALYAAAGGLLWWGAGFVIVATTAFGSLLRTDP